MGGGVRLDSRVLVLRTRWAPVPGPCVALLTLLVLLEALLVLLAGDHSPPRVLHDVGKDAHPLPTFVLPLLLLQRTNCCCPPPPPLRRANGEHAPRSEERSGGGLGAPASCRDKPLSGQVAGTRECSLLGGSRRCPLFNGAKLSCGTTMRQV